ncbi:MAG: selenide, water dikinase SelD [Sphaerochaetaceae bacterium]
MVDEVRISQFSRFAGCGAKLGPGLLDKALCGLSQPDYPELIADFRHAEDCGVYRISDDLALVQTIDFFPPICDDPWSYGRIAAANALSDIYAMGAKPITAVSVVCFPDDQLDIKFLREIMEGAMDALIEARTALVGGHSIRDTEVKFGLCVNGTVAPNRVWLNNTWKDKQTLILTKPIGVGIMNTAGRAGMASADEYSQAIHWMQTLNKGAMEVLEQFPISACTDVTGFGLLGHACEMANDNAVGAMVDSSLVHFLPHVADYAAMGLIPAGAYKNKEQRSSCVQGFEKLEETMQFLLFDPQTSGGLLCAVPQTIAAETVSALRETGLDAAAVGYTDAHLKGLWVC